jgi:hypothetical protein
MMSEEPARCINPQPGGPDVIDIIEKKIIQWYGHVKGFHRSEYQNYLWNGYQRREEEGVQGKRE